MVLSGHVGLLWSPLLPSAQLGPGSSITNSQITKSYSMCCSYMAPDARLSVSLGTHMWQSLFIRQARCVAGQAWARLSAAMLVPHGLTKHRMPSSPFKSPAKQLLKKLLGMEEANFQWIRSHKVLPIAWKCNGRPWRALHPKTRGFPGRGGDVPSGHGSDLHLHLSENQGMGIGMEMENLLYRGAWTAVLQGRISSLRVTFHV